MIKKKQLRKALNLYNKLKEKGSLSRQQEPLMFNDFSDDDVQEILIEIQRSDKVKIFKDNDELFIIPEIDNEIYKYKNKELRDALSLRGGNPSLFTIQFVWMIVMSMFFGDEYERTGEPRSYIPVDEIYEKVNTTLQLFKKKSEEDIESYTEEFQISIQEIVEKWDSLSQLTEGVKNPRAAHTRDYYYILKALSFWEEEKLINIFEDKEIRLTRKGRLIPEYYYHREEIIHKIHKLLFDAKSNQRLSERNSINDRQITLPLND